MVCATSRIRIPVIRRNGLQVLNFWPWYKKDLLCSKIYSEKSNVPYKCYCVQNICNTTPHKVLDIKSVYNIPFSYNFHTVVE